jgi:hypothetical protein
MKAIIFFALFFVLSATAGSLTNIAALLPVSHYDLAELAFRQYISADSKKVFHIAFGTNDAPLPADFMARFKAQKTLVRGPTGMTIIKKNIVLDKITGREAVGLSVRNIRITGDTAEVQVVYFATNTSSSTRFYLVREKERWKVKNRKEEWIACGG